MKKSRLTKIKELPIPPTAGGRRMKIKSAGFPCGRLPRRLCVSGGAGQGQLMLAGSDWVTQF